MLKAAGAGELLDTIAEHPRKDGHIERLTDHDVDEFRRNVAPVFLVVTRHDDQERAWTESRYRFEHSEPIEPGHAQIKDHDGVPVHLKHFESGYAVGSVSLLNPVLFSAT